MPSDVSICNRALLRIGQKETIQDLGEASASAQACDAIYEDVRDEVLAARWWNFAEARQFLAQTTQTRDGWGFVYSLPNPCIEPRYIFNGTRPGNPLWMGVVPGEPSLPFPVDQFYPVGGVTLAIPFQVSEGGVLLTDWPDAELVYTDQVTDPNRFTPLFSSALAWRLASELAMALPVKTTLADYCAKKYEMELAKAGVTDLRGNQWDPTPDASYITVRE